MFKRKRFSAIISMFTAVAISIGIMSGISVAHAAESNVGFSWDMNDKKKPDNVAFYGDLANVAAPYADNVFGDTTKGASLEIDKGSNPMLNIGNPLPSVGAGEVVAYSFDMGIDKLSSGNGSLPSYFFQMQVNGATLGVSTGVSVNNAGRISFFGQDTGKNIEAGKWHSFKYLLASNVDNTKIYASLYVDEVLTLNCILAVPKAVANASYTINFTRFCNNSSASKLYVDNISFEKETEATKSVNGFNWDMNNKTKPDSVAFYGDLANVAAPYADNVFGDTTKGASLEIDKGSNPTLNIGNPLPSVGAGEVVAYSFDMGIDKLSAGNGTLPPYFFQIWVNGAALGVATGVTVDNTGRIKFFGQDTGKNIEAGKWHSFKYLLASNVDNTKIYASLYVDEVLTLNCILAVPNAVANERYVINHARFCNNSSASKLYVDNISFEKETEATKSVNGFNWDMSNKTKPDSVAFYGDLANVAAPYADNVFGDTTKGASLEIDKGSNPTLNIGNPLPSVAGGEVVSYSFNLGIDELSAGNGTLPSYFFQMQVNGATLGVSTGVSVNNAGRISFFGQDTGKNIEAGKWHSFKYLLASNPDNTKIYASLFVDEAWILDCNLAIPNAVAYERYTINYTRFCNNSSASKLYVDNISFEKGTEVAKNIIGFNWDMNNKTKPNSVAFYGDLANVAAPYADNVFGDTAKGASLEIDKGTNPTLNIGNPLPSVGGKEIVSYSFDLGIDELSAGNGTLPPYFFQIWVNGAALGTTTGVTIDNIGKIIFFGKDTGKTIEAGKWHSFKYLLASNADNTTLDMSLYVDGAWIFDYNVAIPKAVANASYTINYTRFCNNSSTSKLYVDNISFEKGTDFIEEDVSSFKWNMDNRTVPGAVILRGGLETVNNLYADNVFNDSSKDSSLEIKYATSTPLMEVLQPLSHVEGEVVSYSFDIGIDKLSAGNGELPPYFFQMPVNGRGNINGSTLGMSIDSTGAINFFGKDTGKTLEAGKWHNFKYLLVSNANDTAFYISLCVDGEWVCGYDFAVPNAVEYGGYLIDFVRFCNNSSASTMYVDNINLVKEAPSVAKDCITSESLLIDGSLIHGYKGMDASQLRDAFITTDGAVVGIIRTANGEIVADDADVAEGMTVTVEKGTSMRSYTLGYADMFASTDGSLYIRTPNYSDSSISTYTLLKDNGDGTADTDSILYAAAAYDAGSALTDVKLFPITLTEDVADETVLDISDMTVGKEDTLVIMAWDSVSGMTPVMEKCALKKNSLATDAAIAGAFMDHMVLQRDMPINIWGTSEDADGAKVEISFAGNTAVAVVEDGEWETTLPAVSANATAQTLTVKTLAGEDTISDILVGDVYFVGGQSNSTFALGSTDTWEADRENATADDNIRILFSQNGMNGNGYTAIVRKDPFDNAAWQIAEDITEEEAGKANYGKTMINFSAIGYYFADTLRADGIDVPIGMISIGKTGASIDQLSPASLCTNSSDGRKSQAYNGLIAPVEKMTVKGMLWYQGESDSTSDTLIKSYEEKFAKFINYLRDTTGNKDMPVFMVQLSSHSASTNDATSGWNVPKFRAMQFKMTQSGIIKNLYMVPSLDKGWKNSDGADADHIAHPKYKKPVGQRLAKVAENVLYGGENVLAPVPVSVEFAEGYCTITFDKELAESAVVAGFELIKDGAAYTATAKASGNTVNVVFDDLALANTAADGVRYAFYQAAAPSVASLTGTNGLPVPTFALDNGVQQTSALDVAMISRGAVETGE